MILLFASRGEFTKLDADQSGFISKGKEPCDGNGDDENRGDGGDGVIELAEENVFLQTFFQTKCLLSSLAASLGIR